MKAINCACFLAMLVAGSGCLTRHGANSQMTSEQPITKTTASPDSRLTEIDAKVKLMRPNLRGKQELEILRVAAQTLRWAAQKNMWPDVTIEDLLTHARQEANDVINRLDNGQELKTLGITGSKLWDFRMAPSNDLNGYVSYSVWQSIEIHYLTIGRFYDPELKQLYKDYIVKYAFDGTEDVDPETLNSAPWSYKEKIIATEGEAKGRALVAQMLQRISNRTAAHPELHVKVVAHLMQSSYDAFGVRSPEAIRSYFWLEIQKNLNPANWLQPVLVKNDQPPIGGFDTNADKRGDYGKQVVIGNRYNDRGMIYWYTLTGDEARCQQLIDIWKQDPAHLTKADYQSLYDQGYLAYSQSQPEVFAKILGMLPN